MPSGMPFLFLQVTKKSQKVTFLGFAAMRLHGRTPEFRKACRLP
jgi:hypothetical protein